MASRQTVTARTKGSCASRTKGIWGTDICSAGSRSHVGRRKQAEVGGSPSAECGQNRKQANFRQHGAFSRCASSRCSSGHWSREAGSRAVFPVIRPKLTGRATPHGVRGQVHPCGLPATKNVQKRVGAPSRPANHAPAAEQNAMNRQVGNPHDLPARRLAPAVLGFWIYEQFPLLD